MHTSDVLRKAALYRNDRLWLAQWFTAAENKAYFDCVSWIHGVNGLWPELSEDERRMFLLFCAEACE